jgi:mycoredoxin
LIYVCKPPGEKVEDGQRKSGRFGNPLPEVMVFGTGWCGATQIVRRFLDRVGVSYDYRDIDTDEKAAGQVRGWASGNTSHPTVQIGDQILIEPSVSELEWVLRQCGWM